MKKIKKLASLIISVIMAANIGTSLVFAQTTQELSYNGGWDFAQMAEGTDLGEIIELSKDTNLETLDNSVSIASDGTANVLKWTNKNFSDKFNQSYMTVDIPDIKLGENKVTLQFSMKGDRRMFTSFPALVGTDESGEAFTTNFGLTRFSNDDTVKITSLGISGSPINSAFAGTDLTKIFTNLYAVENDYYDYKFVIDPKTETFRFYHKKDTAEAWTELYAGQTKSYTSSSTTYENFISDGNIATGDLPDTLTSLRFGLRDNYTYRYEDANNASVETADEGVKVFVDTNIRDILRITLDDADLGQSITYATETTDENGKVIRTVNQELFAKLEAAKTTWITSTETVHSFKNISVLEDKAVTATAVPVGNQTVTNVGDDPTDYVKLAVDGVDATVYAQMPEEIDVEVTAANGDVATKTATKIEGEQAYRIETMDLSGMNTAANSLNIYNQSGTVSIQMQEVIAGGYIMSFNPVTVTAGDIVPVPYKEGKVIKNVALNRVGENGENLTQKNYALREGDAEFREALNGRGPIKALTDGVIYGGELNSYKYAPMIEIHNNYTNNTRWAKMVFYTIDLGAEYNVVGMAISGTENGGTENRNYILECNNVATIAATDTTAADTITNSDIEYSGRLGHNANKDNPVMTWGQVVSNFSMDETSRYVHSGVLTGGIRADISEIMVFAYVDDTRMSVAATAVPVGNQTVTNVGANTTEYVKLAVNGMDATVYAQMPEEIDVEVTAANGVVSTKTATKIEGEQAYRIETMDLSGMDTTANSLNIYNQAGTVSIQIPKTTVADYIISFNPVTVTAGDIVPIAYKEGKLIKNVAKGIVPTLVNDKINVMTDRGEIDVVTDGVLYNGWDGTLTARGEKVQTTTEDGETKEVEQPFAENQVIFSINLGAQYELAGVALSGSDQKAGSNRYYYVGSDNNADTTSVADCAELIKIGNVRVGNNNTDYTTNQILSNFSISNNTSQYVHFGICSAQTSISVSELMVFAYVDEKSYIGECSATADAENKITVNVSRNTAAATDICIIALYDVNGTVKEVKTNVANGATTLDSAYAENDYIKVFLWNGLDKMEPHCNEVPVSITK